MALLFLLSSLVLFAAFAFIVRHFAAAHFEEIDQVELDGKLALARSEIERIEDVAAVERRFAALLVGHPGMSLRLVGSNGTAFVTVETEERKSGHAATALRTRSERILHPTLGELRLDAALDITHHEAFLDELITIMLAAAGTALAFAALLGWWLAGRALRPVSHLTRKATAVSVHNFEGSIDAGPVPVELQELAAAFDAMLARLRESFERLADYSVDLAHELQTPLNNVITQAEVALSRPRASDEYREVLYVALDECRRLSRMVAEMLFIARAEKGLLVPQRVAIDLAATAAKVAEYFRPLAAENELTLVEHGAATIVGDPLMIERAIANLLSNAVRHARPGTEVEIAIERRGERAVLAVANVGESIPADRLGRLFERFYRVDSAERRSGGGTGLGLAITKSIVEAHGGHVRARSEAGVMRFELAFPAGRR